MPKYAKILSYEDFVKTTDLSNHDLQFYLDGMNEENGEISGIFKRARRGDYGEESKNRFRDFGIEDVIKQNPKIKEDVIKEIGDRHWYTLRFLQEIGVTWDEVIVTNRGKLKKRKESGKIMGHGDNREN